MVPLAKQLTLMAFSPFLQPRVFLNPLIVDSFRSVWRPNLSLCIGQAGVMTFFLILAGCATADYRPASEGLAQHQQGIASWYGPSFHGNATANGEIYDMWALTAAHRTLPFGTRVLVHSLETGKTVTVRINDRGPFIRGRIIDLSYGAARELAMIGKGTDEVALTIVASHPGTSLVSAHKIAERYWVQAASFADLAQAVSLQEQLTPTYPLVRLKTITLPSGQWHRVQVGTFPSQKKAKMVARELQKKFHLDPLLIQVP